MKRLLVLTGGGDCPGLNGFTFAMVRLLSRATFFVAG